MWRNFFSVFVPMVLALNLVSCAPPQPEIEVGYQPPIAIPVRVSINSRGEIKVGYSGQFVTPLGTFDISAGVNVNSVRNEFANKVLIVRVDNRAVVYEIEEGKEFRVDFDDSNTLYRKVALRYESNGDIILELESVGLDPIGSSNQPNTNSEPNPATGSHATISCDEGITQVSLRKTPGYNNKDESDIIYKIDCGQVLELLGQSQKVDGLTWWKVSWGGYTGWMADHSSKGRTLLIFE